MVALLHLEAILFLLCSVLPLAIRSNIIVVCRCSDGVVIGSDSLSVSGALVGNRVSESVFRLGQNAVICCASGQSDFQHLLADLRSFIRTADSSHRGAVKTSCIARFARRLATMKYRNTHLIIAGADGRTERGIDSNIRDIRSNRSIKDIRDIGDNGSEGGIEVVKGGDISDADSAAAGVSTVVSTGSDTTDAAVGSEAGADTDSNSTNNSVSNDINGNTVYSVHEVLSGGTLISQRFALAGSGSDCVVTLMDELFPSSSSDYDLITSSDSQRDGRDTAVLSKNEGGQGVATAPPLPSISSSSARVRKVLRASKGMDPRTGSELRVWAFNQQGLKLI